MGRPLVEGIVALPRFRVRSRLVELYCSLQVVKQKKANERQRAPSEANAFFTESRM